jgi:hypothetical protein
VLRLFEVIILLDLTNIVEQSKKEKKRVEPLYSSKALLSFLAQYVKKLQTDLDKLREIEPNDSIKSILEATCILIDDEKENFSWKEISRVSNASTF